MTTSDAVRTYTTRFKFEINGKNLLEDYEKDTKAAKKAASSFATALRSSTKAINDQSEALRQAEGPLTRYLRKQNLLTQMTQRQRKEARLLGNEYKKTNKELSKFSNGQARATRNKGRARLTEEQRRLKAEAAQRKKIEKEEKAKAARLKKLAREAEKARQRARDKAARERAARARNAEKAQERIAREAEKKAKARQRAEAKAAREAATAKRKKARDAARAKKQAAKNAERARKRRSFRPAIGGVSSLAGSIAGPLVASILAAGVALAGLGLAATHEFIKLNGEFESIQVRVDQLAKTKGLNSSALMKDLREFAASTPFQLKEIASAWQRLNGAGFDVGVKEMKILGNVAANSGKSYHDLVEMMLSSGRGMTAQIDNFLGLSGKQAGGKGKIRLQNANKSSAYAGKGKVVNTNNKDDLLKFFLDAGSVDGVAGSIERLSQTAEGLESTLKDNWEALFITAGQEGGALEAYKEFLKVLIEINKEGKPAAVILGEILASVFDMLTNGVKKLKPVVQGLEKKGRAAQHVAKRTAMTAGTLSETANTKDLNRAGRAVLGAKDNTEAARKMSRMLLYLISPFTAFTAEATVAGASSAALHTEDVATYLRGGDSALGMNLKNLESESPTGAKLSSKIREDIREIEVRWKLFTAKMADSTEGVRAAWDRLGNTLNKIFDRVYDGANVDTNGWITLLGTLEVIIAYLEVFAGTTLRILTFVEAIITGFDIMITKMQGLSFGGIAGLGGVAAGIAGLPIGAGLPAIGTGLGLLSSAQGARGNTVNSQQSANVTIHQTFPSGDAATVAGAARDGTSTGIQESFDAKVRELTGE